MRGKQDPQDDSGFGTCDRCQAWIDNREAEEYAKLEKLVADALSPENRRKFEEMEEGLRRAIVGKAIEDGVITFKIGASDAR